jgi:GT2 family glycosyltransferase
VYGLRVSILIINFNGARHLSACLNALEEQTVPRHTFEVILLDNASSDNSLSLLRDHFPWVHVVKSRVNLGFAEGNNHAARFAHASRLILLNNDTVPDPHWLEELFEVISSTDATHVCSKLVFHHDPALIQSAGLILIRDGRGTDYGFRTPDSGQFEETRPVFAGCGAALLVPAPADGEDLFDPSYFVYYEDTSLGWAAQQRGEATIYAPRAVVRHVHGGTLGHESPFFLFYVERNRALTSMRYGDLLLASLAGPSLVLRTFRACFRAARRQTSWANARAFLAASVSFCRHTPRILWARFAR